MRYHLIINPQAGRNQRYSPLVMIKKKFHNRKIPLTISETTKKEDAIKIARSSRADVIIAAGGDGTINEVINGIVAKKAKNKPVLAILPLGTANLFAKSLGIPISLNSAIDLLFEGQKKKIDVGKVNGRVFVLAAGIGMDAHMYDNVQPILKKAFGEVAYPISAINTIFKYNPQRITVKTKDVELHGYYVIICNVGSYGNALSIAPDAKEDDGLLDVIVFEKKEIKEFLRYAFGVIGKYHGLFSDVRRLQTRKVTVTSEEPVLVHADAEIVGTTPVEIEVLADTIEVICGSKRQLFQKEKIDEIKHGMESFVKHRIENMRIPKNNTKIFKKLKDTEKKIKKSVAKAKKNLKNNMKVRRWKKSN